MTEQRVLQPMVIMPPPVEAATAPDVDDQDADRFIEDTTVEGGLTFQEWIARNRPIPKVEPVAGVDFSADIPDD
jgi:hypothetical protein